MNPIPANIAVEDAISEAVLRRLMQHRFAVESCFSKGGYGYLKRTIRGWNAAAASTPFVVLTDLDQHHCATALKTSWLSEPCHANLVFRIAVREVESWLLADLEGMANYLNIQKKHFPPQPDELPDPKKTLIKLARFSASRDVRADLIPVKGSTATQGRGHNARLQSFVNQSWNPQNAAQRSPSLARAINRLELFEPYWGAGSVAPSTRQRA